MITPSLFGDDEIPEPSPGTRTIYAFDPGQSENAQRVVDLAALGYLKPPVLDCTWGWGAMWARYDPYGLLVGTDIDPAKARDVVADVHALPFRDDAFESVMFDPPYKTQGGEGAEQVAPYAARYGHDGSLHHDGDLWVTGLGECCRVARRYVVVKCQDQVDRRAHVCWQTLDVANEGIRLGWIVQDMLHMANAGQQPDSRQVRQRHARRNYSTFVVLRRVSGR